MAQVAFVNGVGPLGTVTEGVVAIGYKLFTTLKDRGFRRVASRFDWCGGENRRDEAPGRAMPFPFPDARYQQGSGSAIALSPPERRRVDPVASLQTVESIPSG